MPKQRCSQQWLDAHLAQLRRASFIEAWHDRKILPGEQWEDAISQNLETANIVILLVSADFLNSDYCYEIELKRAVERHDGGKACVIPIIARPVDWTGAPFAKLQALPKDAKPVTTWGNRDEAWLNVAQGIRRAVEELRKR